ncbi:MAG: DUF998 domain-containing protein, partial [Pirellulaceae bacterium]
MSIRLLLLAGVSVPFLYFGTLIVSSLFYPGYSHVTQYASELGSAKASWPMIFNGGIILTGVASVVAGFGFYGALTSMGSNRALSVLLGLSVI